MTTENLNKKIRSSFVICVSIFIIGMAILGAIMDAKEYDQYTTAINYIEDGNYNAAIEILLRLQNDDYKDSKYYLKEAKTGKIEKEIDSYIKNEEYERALDLLDTIDTSGFNVDEKSEYRDKIKDIKYLYGEYLYNNAQYEDALAIFANIPWYKESRTYYEDCIVKVYDKVTPHMILEAQNYYIKGDNEKALEIFKKVGSQNSELANEYIRAIEKNK